MQRFFICSCYYTDNIFLPHYKLHVRFDTEEQFRIDYLHVSIVDNEQERDSNPQPSVHVHVQHLPFYHLIDIDEQIWDLRWNCVSAFTGGFFLPL